MKSDKSILWIFGGIAAVFLLLFVVGDLPPGLFRGGPEKPVPGKVYQLTTDSLAVARRHSPVLVALFTSKGNTAGARMSRGLNSLAESMKERAIVAVGNLDADPDLADRAAVRELPAWVIYRNGEEVGRATGENADIGLQGLIAKETGATP
jgi:thioredoxin-like negative regulator of GroEL